MVPFPVLAFCIPSEPAFEVNIRIELSKGAIYGGLFTAFMDLSFWSMTSMYDSLVTIAVETILGAVVFALVGMVIVLTWGKKQA